MTVVQYLLIALGGGIIAAFALAPIITSAKQKKIEELIRESEMNNADHLEDYYKEEYPIVKQNQTA